jgi:hypothetical protein
MVEGLAAMQTEEVLLTQKTSRQQAVTPRFGGKFVKGEEGDADVRIGIEGELG